MKYIFLVLLSNILLSGNINAESEIDSLLQVMKKLRGEALLKAHNDLCDLAFAQDDSIQELSFLDAYINEARRQKNIGAEAYARNSKLICFYNYDMQEELLATLPSDLDFMASHKLWDKYYCAWSLVVDMNIYANKYRLALREAEKIYEDASARNVDFGLGVASYNIGNVYHHMQNAEEAEKAYLKAIKILTGAEDMTVLMYAYENCAEVLASKSDYVKMRELTKDWKRELDILKTRYENKGYSVSSLDSKYRYLYEAIAEIEMESGNMEKALDMLKVAEKLTEGNPPVAYLKLFREYARYYELLKDYEKALEYNSRRIEMNIALDNSRGLLDAKEQRAALLMSAGRKEEAAEIYKAILPVRDSLVSAQTAEQLNELSSLYRFDELTMEKKSATTRFYFSLFIVFLLFVVIVSYIIYARELRIKNRKLYDIIQLSQKSESKQEIGQFSDSEGRLYQKLLSLMQDEEVFKDPLLRRDTLVRQLNTNHVYLANAIRKYADNSTINDFINGYRLRYAGNMLSKYPDLSISEIEYMSGFNSRNTFGRLFHEYYGMSPSEYKTISKEKKRLQ